MRPRARVLLRAHSATGIALAVAAGAFAQVLTLALPALLTARLHAGPASYGAALTATSSVTRRRERTRESVAEQG